MDDLDGAAARDPGSALRHGSRADYTWIGRVEQHHHRYYDLWARGDLEVPLLVDPIAVVGCER